MYQKCVSLLKERGVEIQDIVEVVEYLQKGYSEDADLNGITEDVIHVINKREVQHAIMSGIALDKAAEQGVLEDKELESILMSDASLYGIDEVLAYGICNLYGSIALTNFGYVDRVKPGIIGELNDNEDGVCNTYLDDIVGAIAASAASRSAHGEKGGF